MIAKKKEFMAGVALIIGFFIVLILFFLPLYGGRNGLDYLDNLYNSISKGSAYYIPKMKKESAPFKGISVSVMLTMKDHKQGEQTSLLFKAGGAESGLKDGVLTVTGDLGKILVNALADADAMYQNDGKRVLGKYGYDERAVLYNWWTAFKEMDKDLKRQKRFKEADVVASVVKKAIEPSYNYYNVEPKKIGDRFGTVIFSLLFYVIFTLWYGFAVLFMFEGWGLRLSH